jgi:hypothetical protein
LRQLKKHLVLPDHAQLGACPLFDRLEALLEIANVGVELCVTRLELDVDALLRVNLAIQLPDPQPTSFAQPHRILQGEDQRDKDDGKDTQGSDQLS